VHIKANPASHYSHVHSSRNICTVFQLSESMRERQNKEGRKERIMQIREKK
jgi:hypothetical protein